MPSEQVRIQLGDTDSKVIERYEIRQSFFAQPSAFAARVGHGGIAKALLDKYPPGTPFTVWIDLSDGRSVPQMTGRLDEPSPEPSAGATEVNLRGRDWMMPLHDGMPRVEQSFGRATFKELVEKVLRLAGIPDFALDYSNQANQLAVIGTPKFETRQQPAPLMFPKVIERLKVMRRVVMGPVAAGVLEAMTEREMVDVQVVTGYDIQNPIKASPGTTWLSILQQELNRAGLFLFAGVDEKSFILTQPSVQQHPTWKIVRRRGQSTGVISARYQNNTSGRHSHYLVYGRGGGGPDGRKQVQGEYVDEEMVGWGLEKVWSKKDQLAKTSSQALHLARRHCAEARRNGWHLSYKLRGLSWPIIGSTQEGVWCRDAIVDVDDEEYGIRGPMWIGEVQQHGEGKSETATEITLYRPDDLVFGDDVIPRKQPAKRKHFGHS